MQKRGTAGSIPCVSKLVNDGITSLLWSHWLGEGLHGLQAHGHILGCIDAKDEPSSLERDVSSVAVMVPPTVASL